MTFTLKDIAEITSGTLTGPEDSSATVETFIFDSRSLITPRGTMFCAMATDAADGHSFIAGLYSRGMRLFMVERLPDYADKLSEAHFVVVDNVFQAIERLGSAARDRLTQPVVAITGSQGKTVVKEMAYALSGSLCWRSPRSWNSRLGVPMSLLEADPEAEFCIVEAGIDSPGDMEAIEAIVRPDLGVITSITDEHDAGFESRAQKIAEKLKLFKGCRAIIYDGRDPELAEAIRARYSDRRLIDIAQEACLDAQDSKTHTDYELPMAAAICSEMGIMADAMPMTPVSNRLDVHEGVNDCQMIFDGFTPDMRSLQASLDFMRRRVLPTRSLTLIISDIHGPYERLATLAEAFAINRIIGIGDKLKDNAALFAPTVKLETPASVEAFLKDYDINDFSSETILIAGGPGDDFRQIKAMLESARHDTIFEINLDAVVHNFNYYRSLLRPQTGIVAMVKASAYGMGALEISQTMQTQGAAYLAVAVIDEGVELRRGGITMPIMVLNPVTTNYKALFTNRLEPSVFSLRELQTLVAEARKAGVKQFKAHIKLDTGMHRVGFTEAEIPSLIEALGKAPELKVASIFSHLATADCPDQADYTTMQLESFERMSKAIAQATPYPVKRHILNTAGMMTHPEYQYDMCRLGIGLYGISPLEADPGDLRTVATLRSRIVSIKHWPAGTTIGYARRGLLERDSVIATVPIGYADGLNRRLSRGNASFIVRGTACPTVGNICMDQCMIDITDVPGAAIGDDVEIYGNQQPVERLADILDTIPYELLTAVSPRVKRIYYRD